MRDDKGSSVWNAKRTDPTHDDLSNFTYNVISLTAEIF